MIVLCTQTVASRLNRSCNGTKHAEKTVCMPGRCDSGHLLLAHAHGLVRLFRSVRVTCGLGMLTLWQKLSFCRFIPLQRLRDDPMQHVVESFEAWRKNLLVRLGGPSSRRPAERTPLHPARPLATAGAALPPTNREDRLVHRPYVAPRRTIE
jgi:hypothetical protein